MAHQDHDPITSACLLLTHVSRFCFLFSHTDTSIGPSSGQNVITLLTRLPIDQCGTWYPKWPARCGISTNLDWRKDMDMLLWRTCCWKIRFLHDPWIGSQIKHTALPSVLCRMKSLPTWRDKRTSRRSPSKGWRPSRKPPVRLKRPAPVQSLPGTGPGALKSLASRHNTPPTRYKEVPVCSRKQ
jgi:hypothetical protein